MIDCCYQCVVFWKRYFSIYWYRNRESTLTKKVATILKSIIQEVVEPLKMANKNVSTPGYIFLDSSFSGVSHRGQLYLLAPSKSSTSKYLLREACAFLQGCKGSISSLSSVVEHSLHITLVRWWLIDNRWTSAFNCKVTWFFRALGQNFAGWRNSGFMLLPALAVSG